MVKICRVCEKPKDLEKNFYKAKGCKDGYRNTCKQCVGETPSQSKKRIAQRGSEQRARNRQFMWNYYKTHPCVDCGEDDPIVLEPDHVRGKKLRDISKLINNTRSLKVIEEEIAKCDVVCANCHKRRTAATQGWYAGME